MHPGSPRSGKPRPEARRTRDRDLDRYEGQNPDKTSTFQDRSRGVAVGYNVERPVYRGLPVDVVHFLAEHLVLTGSILA